MLPERKWETEPLFGFLAGACFSYAFGMLAAFVLLPRAAASTQEGKFFVFSTHIILFHGGTLFFVTGLLREQGTGWRDGFGFRQGGLLRVLGMALAGVLIALPVAFALHHLSMRGMTSVSVEPKVQEVVQTLQQTQTLQQRVFFAFATIVGAPVIEEIIFRGILYPFIKQIGWPRLALWGTSLGFALIHQTAATFLPLAFFALVLVFLYERTGNLLVPILTHSLFNAANYFALVFQSELKQFFNVQ